jgi:deoxyribose-phosphate aldolase
MPVPATYEDIARLIDHTQVQPHLTDTEVVDGLSAARRLGVAAAIVRPCDIDLAVRTLQGSSVRPGAVCSFPHGSANTATKLYEARDLLRRGAKAIDMVIGVSKLLSREFQHVQTELLQMAESCHKEGATLTVILENGYLTDELKIIACRCAERAEADFVATGTGFAAPHSLDDIRLMRKHVPEEMGVTVAGIAKLDDALAALDAGAGRIATPVPEVLLDEWKRRLAPAQSS